MGSPGKGLSEVRPPRHGGLLLSRWARQPKGWRPGRQPGGSPGQQLRGWGHCEARGSWVEGRRYRQDVGLGEQDSGTGGRNEESESEAQRDVANEPSV